MAPKLFSNVPPVVALGLDQRVLPQMVARRYIRRFISRSTREEKAESAWNNFGKPGRDPSAAKSVFAQLARQNDWVPHLKTADLATHWSDIVGESIARHTRIVSFENGELTIRATSTVWSTQLTYMVPRLKKVISERLAPMEVTTITVKGPNSYTFKRGKYSVPGRGPRDTWG
ncbi:MAG: DciA family protein [Bifidobacteriaceae bacterium]|nr:DciA family protein [Bifidobacteriaceae bacterium]